MFTPANNSCFIKEISEVSDMHLANLLTRGADDRMLRAYINLVAPFGLKKDLTDRFISDLLNSLYANMQDILSKHGIDTDYEDCVYYLMLFSKMLRFEPPLLWKYKLEDFGFSGPEDPAVTELFNYLRSVRVSHLRSDIKAVHDPNFDHFIRLRDDCTEEKYGDRKSLLASAFMQALVFSGSRGEGLPSSLTDGERALVEDLIRDDTKTLASIFFNDSTAIFSANNLIYITASIYTGNVENATEAIEDSIYQDISNDRLHAHMSTVVSTRQVFFSALESGEITVDDFR
ncbi:MAG: hypothetical protein IIY11_02910 [Clostridia bacterium]|nr:hypothetical protein [Clostridia bacterium]